MSRACAAVIDGPSRIALRRFALPDPGADDGLLRVLACGVARGDTIAFRRALPVVPGHEIVGRIERIGADAARRWGLEPGARVVPEPYLPCHRCRWCARGEYRLCDQADAPEAKRLGLTPAATAPGLWGGFADYLYLDPASVLHAVPDEVPDRLATLALPFANGVQAAVLDGGAGPASSVLVLGAGPDGLGAVLAAKRAGAGPVVLAAPAREVEALALGAALGADSALAVDQADVAGETKAATGGRGADVVVDLTPDTSGQVAAAAVAAAAKGAVLVLGGVGTIPFPIGTLRTRYLTVRPARGHSHAAVEAALSLLVEHAARLEPLAGTAFTLAEAAAALSGVAAGDIARALVTPFARGGGTD